MFSSNAQAEIGFGFQPKEEEIIGHFLLNKVAGKEDSGKVIPQTDLYGTKNPWEIWHHFSGDSNCKAFSRDKELYVFTTLKRKDRSPSRFDRRVGLGTWAAEQVPKSVNGVTSEGKCVQGFRRRYRFEKKGSEHHGSWIMIEYSLHEQQISNPHNFVLCKIKQNKRVCVRAQVGEESQLELTDAFAATAQTDGDGDGNENEGWDLLDGSPVLVASEHELSPF